MSLGELWNRNRNNTSAVFIADCYPSALASLDKTLSTAFLTLKERPTAWSLDDRQLGMTVAYIAGFIDALHVARGPAQYDKVLAKGHFLNAIAKHFSRLSGLREALREQVNDTGSNNCLMKRVLGDARFAKAIAAGRRDYSSFSESGFYSCAPGEFFDADIDALRARQK